MLGARRSQQGRWPIASRGMDMTHAADAHPDPVLVLHSSVARLALRATTPLLLLWLGSATMTNDGSPLAYGLLIAGVLTAGVLLLDQPVRVEFDQNGVNRVCLLRRHRLTWSEVVAIERARGGGLRRAVARADASPPVPRGRGLVARVGARRVFFLVDRSESHAEHAELRQLLRNRATMLRAGSPHITSTPAGRGRRALHRRTS
jgi:hypothetical protein